MAKSKQNKDKEVQMKTKSVPSNHRGLEIQAEMLYRRIYPLRNALNGNNQLVGRHDRNGAILRRCPDEAASQAL